MSADPPTPEAEPSAEAPKRAGGGGSVVLIAAAAVLFGVGLGVGWQFRSRPEKNESAEKAPEKVVAGPISLHEGRHRENLEAGDQRFREGSYDEALAAYRETLEKGNGVLRGALQYRIALCVEALGNSEKAFTLYRQVAADETFPQGHIPAQLAQARLLLHTGRYAEAKHYLYPLLFVVDAYPQQRAFAEEARYYLALALAQSLPSAKTGAGSWKVVSPLAIPYELTLDLPDVPAAKSDEPEPHGDGDAKPEPHDAGHAAPVPKLEPLDLEHAKPAPKADPDHDEHAPPAPKVEPHGVEHEKPVPKTEPHHDEHAPPEPKVEPHAVEQGKPAPKVEAHPHEHESPELTFRPLDVEHAKPTPKSESHREEHAPPEPKVEPHGPGLSIDERMNLPHAEEATKPAPKAEHLDEGHAKPSDEPHDTHEKPEPKADSHGDEKAKPERKVEAHETGHEKHDPHAEPKAEPHAEPKAAVEPAEILVIAPARPRTPPIVERGRLSTQPAKTLLDRLAAAGHVKLECSAAAEALIHDRMLRIDIVQWPLYDLVHLLADSLELVSWSDGNVLRIATPAESPSELVEASRWNLVQQTSRTALLAAPRHVLAPAIAIHLGRLELNAERTTQAILCYEEAIRRQVRGPWTVSAWYDLGIVHSGRGDIHAARKAFFACIDDAPGHPLAPLAYLHVARLNLEEGAIGPALTTLARTRRNYPNDPTQAAAAFLTALAQAQAGTFATVERTLAADRKLIADSPYRAAAAFLEGYALYRLAKVDSNARPETARLIEALYTPADTMSAALETQLLGKACREIRMAAEAARIYEKALAWYKGPLRPALELGRALSLLDADQRDEGAALLRSLDEGATNRWSAEASLRLAQIELDDGNPQASADRCRKVWSERQLPDAERVFAVWGDALSALGDFEKASRCYAGNPPE
jgi:tetratricopeptide (TPR) repeat protein